MIINYCIKRDKQITITIGLLSPVHVHVHTQTHTFSHLDTLSLASVFVSLPKYVIEGNKTHIWLHFMQNVFRVLEHWDHSVVFEDQLIHLTGTVVNLVGLSSCEFWNVSLHCWGASCLCSISMLYYWRNLLLTNHSLVLCLQYSALFDELKGLSEPLKKSAQSHTTDLSQRRTAVTQRRSYSNVFPITHRRSVRIRRSTRLKQ